VAISLSDSVSNVFDERPWPVAYLQNHTVHFAVLVVLASYPGVHSLLIHSSFGAEAEMLLPSVSAMITVFYFGLFAVSFNFISGYTGYLSFGHIAFFGTGAYTVVLIANGKVPLLASDTPFMASLVVAGLIAASLALLIGSVSFRLSGVYFAMITLGFAEVLHVFIRNWEYVSSSPQSGVSITGYQEGLAIGIPLISELQMRIGQLRGDTIENLFGLGINFSST
jgi:branched-chain amino acid transport system permease protein